MKIAEIYRSRQGEGRLTGTDSVFVRTSGCNLRCWFCDTPYTSWEPEGHDLALDEIEAAVLAMDASHVVITGGEPMLWAELVPLCERLGRAGRHVTIETAGTLYLGVRCDLMSLSPKLTGSTPTPQRDAVWSVRHERDRHVPQVVRRLLRDYECQIKFVIDRAADCDEVLRYLAEFPEVEASHVWLMPQGTTREELAERRAWIEPICHDRGWNFCPRMQIEWYGHRRGT